MENIAISNGAYDAIVYIEGSEVVAEDNRGRKIASGVAGVNDVVVMQAGIYAGWGGLIKLCGDFKFNVGEKIDIGDSYLDATGSTFDTTALNGTYAIWVWPNSKFTILDGLNIIDDGGAYGVLWRNYANNITLKNSRFLDMAGILLGGGGALTENMIATVSNCYFKSSCNTSAAILANKLAMCNIDNFTLAKSISHGVSVGRKSKITNSQFIDCAGTSIRILHESDTIVDNNLITWTVDPPALTPPNDVHAHTQAILINGQTDGVSVHNNVISNNRIISDPTFTEVWQGIYLHSFSHEQMNVQNPRIYGNTIKGIQHHGNNENDGKGITIGYTVKSPMIWGNHIEDCYEGMYLSYIDGRVWANVLKNCNYGYRDFYPAYTGNRVFDNIFENCDIPVDSAAQTRFVGNTGYATEANGSSTGTGAEQTIAHGLVAAPARVTVLPTGGKTFAPGIRADATNVYVIAPLRKTYSWIAEVI